MDFTKITEEQLDKAFEKSIERFKLIEQIDMTRMQRQIRTARDIIDAYRNGKDNVIVEAPTGFGKSILGFFLTEVIKHLDAEAQTYILTSNKFLQDQYDRDIKLFGLNHSHVLLKGQSNYMCKLKNEVFTRRPCAHLSFGKIAEEKEFSTCSKTCEYLNKRSEAIMSQTTVFNYAYWLTSMNLVYTLLGQKAPFVPRALTIFDESHLLGDIVQQMFGQDINIDRLIKTATSLHKMVGFNTEDIVELGDIESVLNDAYSKLTIAERSANCESEFNEIVNLSVIISELSVTFNKTVSKFNQKLLTEDQTRYITFSESLTTLSRQIEILKQIYDTVGHDSIVLSLQEVYNKVSKKYERHIFLQCTDERQIVKDKVLAFSGNGLFMSATYGNIDKYADQNGIENYEAIYVESDFDFSKSPICHITPQIKMNYKEKAKNMPIMLQYVDKILKNHESERGIIHTGNFEFMKRLQDTGNKRFIFYNNAEEKAEAMRKLALKPNAVICGPSLLEGVDLKDDLARFAIFMKVPYQSLGDKLVKRKMEKYEGWYDWATMLQFLQGLGRTVRNKKDYATTYLLDGSFNWFLQKNAVSKSIRSRIKSVNINNLDSSIEEEFDAMFS